MRYRLCSATVLTKVVPDRTLVRFSKRAAFWCTFSWNVCKQHGHFIVCIQISSFQGYDDIHKSWEDTIKLYYRQMVAQGYINKETLCCTTVSSILSIPFRCTFRIKDRRTIAELICSVVMALLICKWLCESCM